jgi:hypothetical protein
LAAVKGNNAAAPSLDTAANDEDDTIDEDSLSLTPLLVLLLLLNSTSVAAAEVAVVNSIRGEMNLIVIAFDVFVIDAVVDSDYFMSFAFAGDGL